MTFVDTPDVQEPSQRASPSEIGRLRHIVLTSTAILFAQIAGGRIRCESEATLQLHLGRIVATVADLEIVHGGETLSIELEKPLSDPEGNGKSKRGRIDIWFVIRNEHGVEARCAMELKFFKHVNHREPKNRYDAYKDISRLERCGDVSDVGFMLVATDHAHYVDQEAYSDDTKDFDLRHGVQYVAGTEMSYRTDMPHGDPITLASDYKFTWSETPLRAGGLRYLLLEVAPRGLRSRLCSRARTQAV